MDKVGCVQHDCEECQQREKLKVVSVPDVEGLIARLMFRGQFPVDKLREDAATALTALQGQLNREELEGERRARLVGSLQIAHAQQAEQIKEMRELLNWLHIQGGLGLDKHKRIEELLERTK